MTNVDVTILSYWESIFHKVINDFPHDDAAHDLGHLKRVWKVAQSLCQEEMKSGVTIDVLALMTACYLHDIVQLPKNHPERHLASQMASEKAVQILQQLNFPEAKISLVAQAILSHSFSAGIACSSLEAKILQDADRMEALGAIGIARVFYIAGLMKSKLWHSTDPFAEANDRGEMVRDWDDRQYAIDHFYTKLLSLPETMQTKSGKRLAEERCDVIREFLNQLSFELL